MYLISKGTVTYNMPEEYDEKEVRVLKRNWNFGEIEMCSGQPINYYIKIKSKKAEIYTLKKLDFVHLNINFREAVVNFLVKSILLYKEFKEKYYRVIKEKEEYNYYITHTFKKNKKNKNENESDLEENESDESSDEIEKSSEEKKSEINSNNDASDEKSKSGDDESKNKSKRSKIVNSSNKNKKNQKKKLSAGKMQIISALKKEDLKVNKEIDVLIKLMKDSNIVFNENEEDLYEALKNTKKLRNKEEKFNKLNQIDYKLKLYLNDNNQNNNNDKNNNENTN
jgi:hypothetical protein